MRRVVCRKVSLLAALCLGAIIGFMQPAVAGVKKTKPYNILMIAVDDLNNSPGAWGGNAITPNIDRLAKQGTQFLNAYTVVPACNPSRVALMTGLRPEVTGQYRNPGDFRDLPGAKDILTMPQFYRQQGYEAVAAGKIFHKQRGKAEKPNAQSDDLSWSYQAKTASGTPGKELFQDKNGHAKWLEGAGAFEGEDLNSYLRRFGFWGPIPHKTEETGDWENARFCADYMSKKHDQPFLLACGIFRPHSPQTAPQKYFDMYPLDKIQLPKDPYKDIEDLPKIAQQNFASPFAKKVISNEKQWKLAAQAYLASTTFADDCIGEILRGLENSPHAENTIVVLWSDHGWQLAQKHRWEKFSLWRIATNSPMIIKMPGVKSGLVKQEVSLLDVFPTLAKMTGHKREAKALALGGNDLTALVKNPAKKWKHPAVVTYEKGNHSIVKDGWNLIHYQDGSMELYNHATDPHERYNLASDKQYAARIKMMKQWIPKHSI